jgi:hypothetical protein
MFGLLVTFQYIVKLNLANFSLVRKKLWRVSNFFQLECDLGKILQDLHGMILKDHDDNLI